jgi:hypothetical protein
VGSRWHRHRPLRVWVPVSTNVVLVVIAAVAGDAAAVALTAIAAVVTIATVALHVRAAEADQERIAYLQAALPRLRDPSDAEGVLSLAPKPSVVMGEVLRQQKPAISQGPVTPISMWQARKKSQSIDPD